MTDKNKIEGLRNTMQGLIELQGTIIRKEEELLVSFVKNFSCENISTIQMYDASFKLFERAREFISVRIEILEARINNCTTLENTHHDD